MRLLALAPTIALSLALASSARAQTPVTNPTPDQLAQARQHMQAGAAFYNDPSGKHKCEEAYREFKKAYLLSGSLNAVKGMAVCSLELERDGEAIKEYTQYLAGKGAQIDPAEKAQIDSDMKALRAAVATVSITSDAPTLHIKDTRTPAAGYPVINEYDFQSEAKLGLHPGAHTIVASAEGYPDITWQQEMGNGGTYEHRFDFAEAKREADEKAKRDAMSRQQQQPPTRPVPKSVYVAGGLTIALLIPDVILGVRALGKENDYKKANGNEPSSESSTLRSQVKSANLVTDVFLGVTAAAAITTGVLYFTRPTKPAQPVTGLALSPGRATLFGTF